MILTNQYYYTVLNKYIAILLFTIPVPDIYQLEILAGLAGTDIDYYTQLFPELVYYLENPIDDRYLKYLAVRLDKPPPQYRFLIYSVNQLSSAGYRSQYI